MSLRTSFFFAWQSVTRQPLRSFLALLGITVGALAMVSVVSVEQSWRQQVERAFEGTRLNVFYISIPRGGWQRGAGPARTKLSDEDAEAIRQQCPAVEKLSNYSVNYGEVHAGRQRAEGPSQVYAIDADFADIFGLRASEGRLLSKDELAQGAPVCVIAEDLRKALYPGQQAVGQQLRLQGMAFRVVGVYAPSDFGPVGAVQIPVRLYRQVFRAKPQTELRGFASDPRLAARQIDRLMRQRIGGDEKTEFVQGPWVAREAARKVRNHIELVGLLAAFCALLLGGYGVGAVLYVSVAESAREIGIRRALGASKGATMLEVVLAGVTFGVVGAGAGVGLGAVGLRLAAVPGVLVPRGFQISFSDLAGRGAPVGMPSYFIAAMGWQPVAAAVGLSLLICIIASLEPAFEVSNLDPARAVAMGLAPNRRLRLGLAVMQTCIAVAVIALLPSFYESFDEQDRRGLQGAFRTNLISVGTFDMLKQQSWGGGQKPAGWNARVEVSFIQAVATPNFARDVLSACPSLKAAEPFVRYHGPTSVKGARAVPQTADGINRFGPVVVFVSPTYYPRETAPTAYYLGRGHIEHGQFFTEAMARAKERVCVLDTEATEGWFGGTVGVGQTIRINGVPFRVVGTMAGGAVTERRGGMELVYSGRMYVPITTYDEVLPALLSGAQFRYEPVGAVGLHAYAKDEASIPKAAEQLRAALAKLVPQGLGSKLFLSEPIYGSLREYLGARGAAAKRSAFCTVALLVVALVGLANTLLVSLNEQMRELGIRRALGAQKAQVMIPLLTEGAALAGLGSVLGILLAWFLSWGVRAAAASYGFFSLSGFWTLGAAGAMVLTSLLVSLIPGSLATRVNPATALRSE